MKISFGGSVPVASVLLQLLGALTVTWHGSPPVVAMAQPTVTVETMPRVRREWRNLSTEQVQRVADAMWKLKTLSTAEGQEQYGPGFMNHDDLLYLHACSVFDPRCDQGHSTPSFITFHKAMLLRYEHALLAVDPLVEAMPYWDFSKDAPGGEYFEVEGKYFFSDSFMGDYSGNPDENYAVTNGLFAYWPVVEWTEERFGSLSSLPGACAANEWFPGTVASVCDRCCGATEECVCNPEADTYTRYLRNHDDCQPYVARRPNDIVELAGTRQIIADPEGFDKCVDPSNIPSWMGWMRCVDLGEISCVFEIQAGLGNVIDPLGIAEAVRSVPFGNEEAKEATAVLFEDAATSQCTMTGYYFDQDGNEGRVPILHTQLHLKMSADFEDVAASPNDVGLFFGYHSNIDRSLLHWQLNTLDELESVDWHFPKDAFDIPDADSSFTADPNGPYGVNGFFSCAGSPEVFNEFTPFVQPWYNGTTWNDICNMGFPFTDIFDTPPADPAGYTNGEIVLQSTPKTTPYIYDTMEKYYVLAGQETTTLATSGAMGFSINVFGYVVLIVVCSFSLWLG